MRVFLSRCIFLLYIVCDIFGVFVVCDIMGMIFGVVVNKWCDVNEIICDGYGARVVRISASVSMLNSSTRY